MVLRIVFKFSDGGIKKVYMKRRVFWQKELCAGNGKSHFENIKKCQNFHNFATFAEYGKDIACIMYSNCKNNNFIHERIRRRNGSIIILNHTVIKAWTYIKSLTSLTSSLTSFIDRPWLHGNYFYYTDHDKYDDEDDDTEDEDDIDDNDKRVCKHTNKQKCGQLCSP
jgi:hypothetical protein